MKKTNVLLILDGFGLSEKTEYNAIAQAKKPNIDRIFSEYGMVQGNASGLDVGLPKGQMGNSEVGHLNIGAGRVVYQELTRISKSIDDGDFFDNDALLRAIQNVKDKGSDLHLIGLLSDGGVHSHIKHLYALLELAKLNNIKNVYVHVILDGRDTPPSSGQSFLNQLESKMKELGTGKVASIMGRYYAMDRDNRWDRVKLAYNALVKGEGETEALASDYVSKSYSRDVYDEFVKPCVIIDEKGKALSTISEDDSVVFFNFRPDRAREITRVFCDKNFDGFERTNVFFKTEFVCFTEYDTTIDNKSVAFDNHSLINVLGEYVASCGLKQLRIAETEKYAHVTFFFNGGVETPYENEDRILVSSPKVATYDLQPEMSVFEVSDKLCEAIKSQKYDLIIANFANADMVGHTGVLEAAIKAIESVDKAVGNVYDAVIESDSHLFICADHGNAEKMVDEETGEKFTAHTTNPVPFVLVNSEYTLKENGKLSDIAPTLLDLLELEKPKEMQGTSLLNK